MTPSISSIAVSPSEVVSQPGPAFYRQLFDNLYDGVYYVDRDRKIVFWNQGAERISGLNAAEVVGKTCGEQVLDHLDQNDFHLCANRCPLVHAVETGEPTVGRVWLRHRDGWRIAVDVHIMPVHDTGGRIIGAVEVFRDASSIVALETALAKLRDLAMKDPLTKVANRRHLDDLLDLQVDMSRRAGLPFSVIMADLDHFKRVNDTWGHPVGDQVLVWFADLAKLLCRTGDTVGRFGGEELLILLPESHLDTAAAVAERLRAAVAQQAPPGGLAAGAVTVGLGVAEMTAGDTVEAILHRVDEALYRAKAHGRNRVETQSLPNIAPQGRKRSRTSGPFGPKLGPKPHRKTG